MKLIGQGSFTKAYLKENGRVFLDSTDPVKECMSLGWFPENRMFPTIERLENGYEMDFYERPKGLKNNLSARQWSFYKALRALDVTVHCIYESLYAWEKAFANLPAKFNKEKDDLIEALNACSNYGQDVCFEISPRNVAVKGKRLVLLDCFFMRGKLLEKRGLT